MTDFNTHPAVQLAQILLRFPSFTPDTNEAYIANHDAQLYLGNHARNNGGRALYFPHPSLHRHLEKDEYRVPNLLTVWKKGDWQKVQHVPCFIGHTDVVPLGDEKTWSVTPFGGDIQGPYLYGRGATDMKGAVAAFFTAAAFIMEDDSVPDAHFMAIITGDEEWEAKNGTRKVLEWMKENDTTPTCFLVGEPSSPSLLGTHLKIGRRGSYNFHLEATGVQNHVAYAAEDENPFPPLALAQLLLGSLEWDAPDPDMVATSLRFTKTVGDGGLTSIVPAFASARFNVRFNIGLTPETLIATLQRELEHIPDSLRELFPVAAEGLKNVKLVPSPAGPQPAYLSKRGFLTETLIGAIVDAKGIYPELDTSGGITDGRFVQDFFPDTEVVEFGPPENGGSPLGYPPAGDEGGMHQVNERILVEDLVNLSLIYTKVLLNCAR